MFKPLIVKIRIQQATQFQTVKAILNPNKVLSAHIVAKGIQNSTQIVTVINTIKKIIPKANIVDFMYLQKF